MRLLRPVPPLLAALALACGAPPAAPRSDAARPPQSPPAASPAPPAPAAGAAPAESPPRPGFDRQDDALPEGAVARLGTLRLRHRDRISSIALSADGGLLASTGGALHLWEARTGKEILFARDRFALSRFDHPVFTPDGKRLLATVGEEVHAFSTADGASLGVLAEPEPRSITAMALAPDGLTLAVAADEGTISLRDAQTGALRRTIRLPRLPPPVYTRAEALAFSADGKLLLSIGTGDTVQAWDTGNGREVPRLRRKISALASIDTLATSPAGDLVAYGGGDHVHVVEIATGAERFAFPVHIGPSALAFSHDGARLAAAPRSGPDLLLVWDLRAGKLLRAMGAQEATVHGLAFSPDGRTLHAGYGHRVHAWDVGAGREVLDIPGHDGAIQAIAVAADSRLVATGGEGRRIRLWDLATSAERFRLGVESREWGVIVVNGHDDYKKVPLRDVNALAFVPASAGAEVWGVPLGRPARAPALLSTEEGGVIRVWDAEDGALELARKIHGRREVDLAVSANGALALTGGSGGDDQVSELSLWELASGQKLRSFSGDVGWLKAVALSPRGDRAAAVGDDGARVWDAAREAPLAELAEHRSGARAAAFSPDGRRIAAVDHGAIHLWTADGAHVRELDWTDRSTYDLAFSPDGALLAGGTLQGVVEVWHVERGALVAELRGHRGAVRAVAFTPDGRLLLSGSEDTTALAWRVQEAWRAPPAEP